MNSDNKTDTSEVVFLVGAGISIPVDIPAMKGMYKAFLSKTNSEITPGERSTCTFFARHLGVPEDLEEFLLAANTMADFEPSILASFVEKALSVQKGTRRLRDYRKRLNKRIQDVVAVRKAILGFMSRTCFRFDRNKACDIFGEFVSATSKQGYPIYSTNYDFVLEHVAMVRKIPIEDNFHPQGQRDLWNPDIHFPLGGALTLIKLHGSVTWYADKEGEIEKILTDVTMNLVGKDVDRLVIFPTRFKDIYDQHFFALYSHFLSALSDAQLLVVLGHSLRDDYLRAGIIERYRKGEFQIVVVDPVFPKELLPELRPAKLGAQDDVIHVPYEFEDFSDELTHLILNSSPSDLAASCSTIASRRVSKRNKIDIRGNIGPLKPGETKNFAAVVDAYLLPHQKPAYLRVWLSTKYTIPAGQKVGKISSSFLDRGKVQLGSGLEGTVQGDFPLTIQVPDYPEWIEHTSKATLHVAIVPDSVKTPSLAKNHFIASAERELTYIR